MRKEDACLMVARKEGAEEAIPFRVMCSAANFPTRPHLLKVPPPPNSIMAWGTNLQQMGIGECQDPKYSSLPLAPECLCLPHNEKCI